MLFKWNRPGTEDSDISKLNECSLASSGLKEKDLENLLSKRIQDLVRTDQLMVIMQQRKRQEDPDVLAIDEHGIVFIFELKRWEGRSEHILQALRYGQKFGRHDYEKLNWFYQAYSHTSFGTVTLQEAHREFFELERSLDRHTFNTEQEFVVITNGLDYDTWDAVAYWRKKGLRISCLVYRLFRLSEGLYIDFDPYGPIPDAPRVQEEGLFVVNTNKTYMPETYKEMVFELKAAAYYDRKYSIQNIRAGNQVCLYHVGPGVIGIGKAKTDYLKKAIDGDIDEEYYVPIDFEFLIDITEENWPQKAVHAWEINSHFNTGHRFRQTVFQLPAEFAGFIRKRFKENGVRKPDTQKPGDR